MKKVQWGTETAPTDIPLCRRWAELGEDFAQFMAECKEVQKTMSASLWSAMHKHTLDSRADTDKCPPWEALQKLSGKEGAVLLPVQFNCLPKANVANLACFEELGKKADEFVMKAQDLIATASSIGKEKEMVTVHVLQHKHRVISAACKFIPALMLAEENRGARESLVGQAVQLSPLAIELRHRLPNTTDLATKKTQT